MGKTLPGGLLQGTLAWTKLMFGRLSWLTMTLIHIVRSLSLALLMLTHEANAQSPPVLSGMPRQESFEARASLLARVAFFRLNALGGSTRFPFCEAARLVGDAGTLKHFLRSNFPSIELFRNSESPCDERPNRDDTLGRITRLDSMRLTDDSATVFSSVRQNEHLHRELFNLSRRKGGRGWEVTKMTVYGILRLH